MRMEQQELEIVVSECLNNSNFWKMLDYNLKRRYNLSIDTDEMYVLACDVEAMIAEQIINYEPYEEDEV